MDTYHLSERLLPELTAELEKTRKILLAVPDGHNDFAAHPKSMPLTRLAGHTAELARTIEVILTHDSVDMGTPADPRKILRMETKQTLLAEFNEMADNAVTALKATTDDSFDQTYSLKRKGAPVFSGTRYAAYRSMGVDHMIHHRAQLGVYLRLLDQPVPGTFGSSADEHPPAPPTR